MAGTGLGGGPGNGFSDGKEEVIENGDGVAHLEEIEKEGCPAPKG